jgi:hypothetical protein
MNIFNKLYLEIVKEGVEGFNPITASKEVMNSIYRIMKSKGYAVKSGEDCRSILKSKPKLLEFHEDWIEAVEKARERKGERIKKAEEVKRGKEKYSHIDWSIVRGFGFTNHPKEVGYIDLRGNWVNLSGGSMGERGEDHRVVGGSAGMQELMDYGYIRVSEYLADIRKEPTKEQIKSLWKFIYHFIQRGDFYIRLDKGLGEWDERMKWYGETGKKVEKEFKKGDSPNKVITFIIDYYKV